ncbi:MAG: hypothetical protein LBT27_09345 [Prevotellaceae bacterium]|jgi:hypothetical protein|nr:hypothetical protein [Prevotellaceae bacterium]
MKENEIRDFFYNALSTYGLKYGKKELSVEGLRIDIFAIDKQHIPYIIEFKKEKNRYVVGQAAQYLSLVPTYNEQIEKEINFYDIQWNLLKVICIAPDFLERDYKAAEYEPLKGKVHFYTFNIIENSRNKIFSLNIEYKGPDKTGPLIIPKKIIDKYDVRQISEELHKIDKKEAKREYYSKTILPLLSEIGNYMNDFQNLGLYPHNSYWGEWFEIRFGTNKKKPHRASLNISFFFNAISYGFNLTHSLDEGKKLSLCFKDEKKCEYFIKNTLELKDYFLWIPNTGIDVSIPISQINAKGLNMLLKAYNPEINRDCYFHIQTYYTKKTINVKDAADLLKEEYNKFKYIFELLM